MKILHVNTYDVGGGAAIAAMRHCEAMTYAGIDAQLMCVSPKSGKSWVHNVGPTLSTDFWRRVYPRLNKYSEHNASPYATWSQAEFGFNLSRQPLVNEADEIWLHWINGGMLSVSGVEKLLATGKPITWYLHDMWPLTGGCHYSLGCNGFHAHCGKCPLLNDHIGSIKTTDISSQQLEKKLRLWRGYDSLRIIAPSHWLCDQASKSALFGNGQTKTGVLPNPLDTRVFHPVDKQTARKNLNLPLDKPLILFGAVNVHDPYKGFQYLQDAFPLLQNTGIECVAFGNADGGSSAVSTLLPIHYMGHIKSVEKLRDIYSASDIFVTPSIADNYPNVLVEAMACGTPCVGFNIGGVPEIIKDKDSGIIASQVSPEALADAIVMALNQKESLSNKAINQIAETNSFESYIQQFNQIFK